MIIATLKVLREGITMIKVSIIIPVYNVDLYLEKCLNSCVNQTLKEIEIIVINDASPDTSDRIMREFECKYPQKIVNIFLHKNLKQGGARNIGINKARGKYLCFVDGDDYIDKTMCEKLYLLCEERQLDIACCDGYFVYKEKKIYRERYKRFDFEKKNSVVHFTGQSYMIIRKEIIMNYGIFYPPHTFHEDTAVVPIWYLLASNSGLLEEPLYYQNIHIGSTTASINYNLMLQMLETLWILIENAKKADVYDKHKDKIDCFIIVRMCYAAKNFLKIKDSITIEEKKILGENLERWKNYLFDETSFLDNISRGEYDLVKHFILDYEHYFVMSWNECEKKIINTGYPDQEKKICHLLNYIKGKKKNIVIWGVGEKGKPLLTTVKKIGADYVVGDNNSSYWGKKMESGDVVRSKDWICENVSDPIFLITATRFYHGIMDELKRSFTNIVAVDVFAYIEYDLSIEEIFGCFEDMN